MAKADAAEYRSRDEDEYEDEAELRPHGLVHARACSRHASSLEPARLAPAPTGSAVAFWCADFLVTNCFHETLVETFSKQHSALLE